MKIVIHAGLHKSGTTSIQDAWRFSFSQGKDPWFPILGDNVDAHHQLAWHYDSGYRTGEISYLEYFRSINAKLWSLEQLIEIAESNGVKQLLISSEEFDHFTIDDSLILGQSLKGHDVTTIFTATKPIHRFFSGWQEFIKLGLSTLPQDCESLILDYSKLSNDGFRQLIEHFPGQRKIVRLVRDSPPEVDLAKSVLKLFSQSSISDSYVPESKNRSLGPGTETLRQLNASGKTIGLLNERSRKNYQQEVAKWGNDAPKGVVHEFQSVLSELIELAGSEKTFLEECEGTLFELFDPHLLLSDWQNSKIPDWFESTHIFSEESRLHEKSETENIEFWKSQLFWAADERRIFEELNVAIAERDGAIAERERVVADRDASNLERDNALAERDNALADRDTASLERDNALAERDNALAERDNALADRDTSSLERDDALAERERAIAERDSILSSRIWRATSFYRKMRTLPREH